MVVHTPTKLEVLRQAAAANAAERRSAEQAEGEVPPSVLAAQEAAGVDGSVEVATGDAVGDVVDRGTDQLEHDYGAGLGNEDGTEREVQVNVNVLNGDIADGAHRVDAEDRARRQQEEDDIRAADAAAPPPPPPAAQPPLPPGLDPFTPEWFTQLSGPHH